MIRCVRSFVALFFCLNSLTVFNTSVLSSFAFAQSSSASSTTIVTTSVTPAPVNTSVAQVQTEKKEGFKLPVQFGYVGTFFGPEVQKPLADWTPAARMGDFEEVANQEALSVRHNLSVMKDFGKGYRLSGHLTFDTVMTDPAGDGNTRGFYWLDNYIRFTKIGLFETTLNTSNFRLDTQIRAYLPTSERSRINNTLGAYRFYLNPNLNFGRSIFSLTASNYAMVFAQSRTYSPVNGAPLRQLELYTGPQLNAQVHPNVNVFLLYEAVVHMDTVGFWDNNVAGLALTDLEPGVDIQIGNNLTITPFLNWYTALPINTTSLNLSLSASI